MGGRNNEQSIQKHPFGDFTDLHSAWPDTDTVAGRFAHGDMLYNGRGAYAVRHIPHSALLQRGCELYVPGHGACAWRCVHGNGHTNDNLRQGHCGNIRRCAWHSGDIGQHTEDAAFLQHDALWHRALYTRYGICVHNACGGHSDAVQPHKERGRRDHGDGRLHDGGRHNEHNQRDIRKKAAGGVKPASSKEYLTYRLPYLGSFLV